MPKSESTALAFKIPSEPRWRVVDAIQGDPVPEQPGMAYFQLQVKPVAFWGVYDRGRHLSIFSDLAQSLFGLGGGPQFQPLDQEGQPFVNVRRLVSPVETLTDEELLEEVRVEIASPSKITPPESEPFGDFWKKPKPDGQ